MQSLSSRLGLPVVVGLVLAIAPLASAQTYAWSPPGTNNLWSNSGNWSPSGVPNLIGDTARFLGGTGTNVDVNGTFTLGRLTVEALNAQLYYDLATTSGGSLTFNNGASDSVIESLPGTGGSIELYLKVPVVIAGNGNLQINNATGVRLQISGNISGAGSNITINAGGQTGIVTLIGTNSYGTSGSTTTVSGGTLRANEGIGLPVNSTLVLSGGVFELYDPDALTTDFTFNRDLGTGVANARLIGGGTTRAGFSVFEGTLTVRLNNDATTVINWGAPNFDPGVLVLGTASPTESNIVIFENALNFGSAIRTVSAEGFGFANSSYSLMTGVLSGTGGGLTKQGDGILELTNSGNSYTGRTTISAGVLRANSGQGLPTASALTINGGVLENRGGSVTFSRNIGTGAGQVELISGGFSAFDGAMTIQLNGGSGTVTWGTAGFYATGGAMRLGSTSSNALVNFTNGINLGGAVRTVEVDGSGSPNALARLSGPISNGSLTIIGNGVSLLELTGSNTYTGETRVSMGTVRANHGQGLPSSSPLFLDDGGILESIGAVTFSRGLGNGAGQVRLSGNSGFAASGGPMTILLNGSIATVTWGDANFLPGTGSLVLGSFTANDLVDFQNGIDLGGQVRTVTVLDNALSQSDRARISGAISNGSLTKLGDGVLELTGPNVYTGQTSVLGGVLRANNAVGLPVDSALLLDNFGVIEGIGATTFTRSVGTGTGQVEIGSSGGGFSASGGVMTVQLNGGTGTVVWNATAGLAGPLVLGSPSSNNLVDFQNGIDLDGGTVSIYANGGQARISGVISNGGIDKFGPGPLELTAANTYGFTTNVWQGRLVISNGTIGSATGTSTVNVQSGGTLTGSGQIIGANGFNAVQGSRIEPGGTGGLGLSVVVSPGNTVSVDGTWALRIQSPGTGGVALDSGSSTAGAIPSNHTFLVLSSGGTADSVVLGGNARWEIDGTGLTFLPNQRYSYAIGFTAPGEVTAGTITDQSRFTTIGFEATDFSLTTLADGKIILNFTPVPEPVTVFGIAAAGLGLLNLTRRRRS